MNLQPPRWVDRILDWYCHPAYREEIKGDLFELYQEWRAQRGSRWGNFFYFFNLILFLRAYNSRFSVRNMSNYRVPLIRHFFTVSVRNLVKHRTYHITNILGLSLGVGLSCLIFLHVDRELSYEKDYPKYERIFRVSTHQDWAKSSPVLGPEMKEFFPELEDVARLKRYGGDVNILEVGSRQFAAEEVFEADPSAIHLFDLHFEEGSGGMAALERPWTSVITASLASKLFPEGSPIGQTIEINDDRKVEVTGVIADLPELSHLKVEMLISMASFYDRADPAWFESRGWMVMYTYALIKESATEEAFRAKMPAFQNEYIPEDYREAMANQYFEIMDLAEIHLHSNRIQEMGENSNVMYVYIFSSLAVIILIVACANFINIFTSLLLKRIKEVNIRKVIGSRKSDLFAQLVSESTLTSMLGFAVGLGLCLMSLPTYNQLASTAIDPWEILTWQHVGAFVTLAILVGVLSGCYPAYLAVNQYWNSEAKSGHGERISTFRRVLVVFQFSLSLTVLTLTAVVFQQLRFINSQDLGYSNEQLVAISTYGDLRGAIEERRESIFARLDDIPGVTQVALSSNLPGEPLSVEGFALDKEAEGDQDGNINMIWVDEHFRGTMEIELIAGRDFDADRDSALTFLVNEQLATQLGGDVLGQRVRWRDETGIVVGIIGDYHHYSLHKNIWPTALAFRPSWAGELLLKMEGSDPAATLARVEATLQEVSPGALLLYNFMDDRLRNMYRAEDNMLQVVGVFALLAMVISGIGLMGLASLEVTRRTKEVGVRKVLGASTGETLYVLGRQFIWVIALSVAISIPFNYVMSRWWLSEFTFQAQIGWMTFALPALFITLLAALIVIGQALKLIRANPVHSLRYE